ncbi:hypothetical protein [Methylogaea oryzae]|uniref:Lipoprotein n=1 Tax=Methylogaea oryzae TaxID=1295382 RepID=A0A8D4VR72_9GAMM|nr:hypothetical protein [Methylogaea oryzae]BBL72217.1 lipoprotein [Methylogaea oryzae]
MKPIPSALALGALLCLLCACSEPTRLARMGGVKQTDKEDLASESFSFKSLGKTDVDLVGETHQKIFFADLKQLAEKLYRRNPGEWRKSGHTSLEEAMEALFKEPYPQPNKMRSIDCIRLTFDEAYRGDRVESFIAGIATMTMEAYNDTHDYYFTDMLDAQKLYNSARNIEAAAWLLRSKVDSHRRPFLYSYTPEKNQAANLSFERLLGRLISNQDIIAQVTADRTHRNIKGTIQSAVMFIPL